MAFDSITAYAVVKELNNKILNMKVNKIYQPSKDEVIFHIFGKEKAYLLLNASSNASRINLTNDAGENPNTPPAFCMLLRKYLSGAIIKEIKQVEFDRIVKIKFETLNALGDFISLSLIAEIMGKNSNIILVDNSTGKILDSLKHITYAKSSFRQVLPNQEYTSPPGERLDPTDFNIYKAVDILLSFYDKDIKGGLFSAFNGLSPVIVKKILNTINESEEKSIKELSREEAQKIVNEVSVFFKNIDEKLEYKIYTNSKNKKDYISFKINTEGEIFSSPSLMIDKFYNEQDKSIRLKEKYTYLFSVLEKALTREKNKLEIRKKEYESSQNAQIYNQKGQILLTILNDIKKGQREVTANNFYENMKEIKISLEPNLTPIQNANKYFKKYNKAVNASKHLKELIKENEEMIYFLESQLLFLNNASLSKDAEDIEDELILRGIIKNKRNKKSDKSLSTPYHFISEGDFDIFIGKNSIQNDRLTKSADKDDMWFHTKDIPGSHVILRTNGKTPDKETIEFCAMLSAFYSKGKNSSMVPVDYTLIKYVRKPNKAAFGKVIYTNYKTIYITLTEENEEKIKRCKLSETYNNRGKTR